MNYDYVVIGGGVVGLSIARELKRSQTSARVVILEKEKSFGEHASTRNSGVLHAGFYYTADSLKARFTRAGNEALTAYCRERNIPVNACGKLVVARGPEDLPAMDELLLRGRANGVLLESVTAAQAEELEPRVKTFERALFSPTTSSVDPNRVLAAMTDDARREGIELRAEEAYQGLARDGRVRTSRGVLSAGYVVNCAGLYADRVARDFGFSQNYRILPFKGLYLYSNEPAGAFRRHIYPVPDLRNPFLGVHFTLTAEGRVKIGPTAIPAFWREQYNWTGRFKAGEFGETLFRHAGLLAGSSFDFRGLALREIVKYSRKVMSRLASELAEGVDPADYRRWGRPGIRAQLFRLSDRKLEMDFVIEGDKRSLHVLNAVSPGFTCSIPFAEHVVGEIHRRLC
ncbi:MAG: L-2-hydroxyglutarate oxidase [Candidatus Omnitrophica bacterium]|nr:L-2-hydroxyglutarate oxidase [Candidatus Omnitrophota bacterium]